MKIKRFIGRSVNSYLNFDISFFDQLTFVTGINGSGKTTALNSIAALLLPRLDYLAGQHFEELTIQLSDNQGNNHSLTAIKNETMTEITCTSFPEEKLIIEELDALDSVPQQRAQEYEDEYNREVFARNKDNPVLTFIVSLPTPMYLGLDRRSLSIGPDRLRYRQRPIGRSRARRNIFGRSLEAGLSDALVFAREQFQEDRRREVALDEKFRESLVLELIDFPLFSLSGNLEEPTQEEQKNIEEARAYLERLPELLNVDKEIILKRLNPVFQFLNEKFESIKSSPENSDDRTIALFEWSYNKTNLDKISKLSELISRYTREINEIKHRTNEYLRTINGFMRDSGKTILFNDIGELRFKFNDEGDDKSINSFASGEIQLVVILTHLYFNPEVAEANIFIIDEPELSLHVQWQEKFVDGIVGASRATQFILATHSPSIILNRTDHCVEISQQR